VPPIRCRSIRYDRAGDGRHAPVVGIVRRSEHGGDVVDTANGKCFAVRLPFPDAPLNRLMVGPFKAKEPRATPRLLHFYSTNLDNTGALTSAARLQADIDAIGVIEVSRRPGDLPQRRSQTGSVWTVHSN
jgi:hypothetical protein